MLACAYSEFRYASDSRCVSKAFYAQRNEVNTSQHTSEFHCLKREREATFRICHLNDKIIFCSSSYSLLRVAQKIASGKMTQREFHLCAITAKYDIFASCVTSGKEETFFTPLHITRFFFSNRLFCLLQFVLSFEN
jgi:hypothetical protein